MKVFVLGATGFQGSQIASTLLQNNHSITTLKRDPNAGMPPLEGIRVIQGGLDNQSALSQAMNGADAAVFSFPLIFDMELAKSYTENFIAAAKQENIGLVIYNTTFFLAKEATGLLALDMKVEMKKLFDASGLNVITLTPNIYLDNIAAPWSIPVILENKIVPYPLKADKVMSWVSHSDLGKYVASALTKPELAGQTLPIGGKLITGNEITTAIGSQINQDLNFVEVPVDEFEQQLVPGFGPVAAKEISNLYRYIDQNYNDFIALDYDNSNKVLDVQPQSLGNWATSVDWNIS